jgi:tRNA modification GTPase
MKVAASMKKVNPERDTARVIGRHIPAQEDTIAAIATPPGEGGIGIVRISGPEAIAIAGRIFIPVSGKSLPVVFKRVQYGHIVDGTEELDEVLLHVMRSPHSYTREDVVEINCHGGAGPLHAVLNLVLANGARLAGPGEFTKRAFLNGRLDLIQAEAVIDRIRAQTRAGLRAASSAAGGTLSKSIYALRDALSGVLARVEAAIDFPEEEIPEQITDALRAQVEDAHAQMLELLRTADAGRLYREGASVAIAGRPNVGKSSLFNALLRDARAIVTATPGTTRDLIEETVNINGIPVRLSDTAGFHESSDEVEQLGIERARNALRDADAVLIVLDATRGVTTEDHQIADEVKELDVPTIVVVNKVDAAGTEVIAHARFANASMLRTSARTGQGLPELEDAIGKLLLNGSQVAPDQGLVNRAHQRDSLRRASEALDRMLVNFGASPEFLSIELKDALDALGQITGETTPDDLLEMIFSSFCIGK